MPVFAITVLAASGLLIAALIWLLPPSVTASIIAEGGVVESLSALLWFVAALALLAAAARGAGGWLRSWEASAALVLAACTFRELGLRKQILSSELNVMKAPFWLSESVPAAEKFVVALVLAVVAASLCRLLLIDARRVVGGLKQRTAPAVIIFTALLVLVIAQWVEGGMHGIRLFGIADSAGHALGAQTFEECMELTAAGLIAGLSIHTGWQRFRPTAD